VYRQSPVIDISNSLLKNIEFVIPNGVCGVRNLSFLGILIEEGFIAQKKCDAKSYLASLGMTAKRIFQQPAKGRLFYPEPQRAEAGRSGACSRSRLKHRYSSFCAPTGRWALATGH
jgi:hypothetical protein